MSEREARNTFEERLDTIRERMTPEQQAKLDAYLAEVERWYLNGAAAAPPRIPLSATERKA